jgi:hypothetical protein
MRDCKHRVLQTVLVGVVVTKVYVRGLFQQQYSELKQLLLASTATEDG